jgi:hypothetical protein
MRVLFALVLATVASGSQAALTLAKDGETAYRIVVSADAIEPERHAAAELAFFLKQITGADFPIVTPDAKGDAPSLTLRHDGNLGPDSFSIETHGRDIVFTGGRPRGVLYAVYTFLEDHVGCRWYSSKVSRIPQKKTLTIRPINDRQTPALEYREPFAFDSYDADWAVRNKSNGHATRLDVKRGGKIIYKGFVHTFESLVPPKKYFATHPEYFSEIKGKRTAEHSQLCLTNPDVVELVAQRVTEGLKDAPPQTIVSVSQNDWHGWCECSKCKALTDEEGGVSGPLLRFVNQVAERIEKVRPDLAIDTLAYQHSRNPPRTVRPRPNVIVRLCSIECSFSHPLGASEQNRKFAEDIEGWSRLCQRLYIWDYVTDFAHYVQPHPNFRVLQPNIQFFIANGVKGIFEQGSYQSPGGELQELRSWLLAKLLWNPRADVNALMDDFLAGYYGPASPFLRRYIDLMHDEVARAKYELKCFSPTTAPFLSQPVIAKADALFTSAEKAVAKDPALLHRVQVARLPVYYVMMQRETAWKRSGAKWRPSLSGRALRERFFEIAAAEKMTQINEGRTMASFREATLLPERRDPTPPPGCEKLAKDRWLDIQDDEFRLHRPGQLVKIAPDPLASDGVAARMPGDHREWAVSMPLDIAELTKHPKRTWRVAVAVRVERSGGDGIAFTCGMYDTEEKKGYGGRTVKLADVNDDGYAIYELGAFPLNAKRYLWVAPPQNPANVKAIWVDRFILIAE